MHLKFLTFCIGFLLGRGDGYKQLLMHVAFSAGLSHHANVYSGQGVIFDTVITNIGGGYNNKTGNFICPQTGHYVFQFHGLSRSGYELYLGLYRDYERIALAYAHNSNDWAAAGNNVIIHVTKGDQIRIQALGSSSSHSVLYGTKSAIYCTFSGYLIQTFNEETPIVG